MSERALRAALAGCAFMVVAVLTVGTGETAGGFSQSSGLPDVSGIPAASPVPYSSGSAAKGKATFLRLCQECHDDDGKALTQAMGPAADLTDPARWKYGTTDAHIFRSIQKGAGSAMPVFGNQLKDDDIWDLVNFIRSIGPASFRKQ